MERKYQKIYQATGPALFYYSWLNLCNGAVQRVFFYPFFISMFKGFGVPMTRNKVA